MKNNYTSVFARFLIFLIKRYQNKGGGQSLNVECNFLPSCSHYSIQAIERYGAFKGVFLSFNRIKRCNIRDLVKIIEDPLE